jgi:hypothetical protein
MVFMTIFLNLIRFWFTYYFNKNSCPQNTDQVVLEPDSAMESTHPHTDEALR